MGISALVVVLTVLLTLLNSGANVSAYTPPKPHYNKPFAVGTTVPVGGLTFVGFIAYNPEIKRSYFEAIDLTQANLDVIGIYDYNSHKEFLISTTNHSSGTYSCKVIQDKAGDSWGDPCAKGKFAGVSFVNGRIVNAWTGCQMVIASAQNNGPVSFTFYVDAFTNYPVQAVPSTNTNTNNFTFNFQGFRYITSNTIGRYVDEFFFVPNTVAAAFPVCKEGTISAAEPSYIFIFVILFLFGCCLCAILSTTVTGVSVAAFFRREIAAKISSSMGGM